LDTSHIRHPANNFRSIKFIPHLLGVLWNIEQFLYLLSTVNSYDFGVKFRQPFSGTTMKMRHQDSVDSLLNQHDSHVMMHLLPIDSQAQPSCS
jgi:hypothetical protein